MRTKAIVMLIAVWCMLFSVIPSYADDKAAQPQTAQPASVPPVSPEKAPAVFLPEEKYEFQPVAEGVEVVHDFVVQNKGTADLEILAVKPG